MKHLVMTLGVMLGLLLGSGNAWATSCWQPTAAEHVASANTIFYGRVISGKAGPADNKDHIAELEVVKGFKGVAEKTVKVRYYNDHGALRGWRFDPGAFVLVFANRGGEGSGGQALPRVDYCAMIPFHARAGLHADYWIALANVAKGPAGHKFEDFAQTVYTGRIRRPKLSSHPDARTYRTRLREAARGKVNFAGDWVLATWGCGTTCLTGAVINARSGRVQFLPGSVCCWFELGEEVNPIDYRADSSLLVLTGMINEEEPAAKHYYELRNGQFHKLD